MKKINFLKFTLAIMASVFLFSCNDDDDETVKPDEKSIVEIVNTNNDFSLLRSALEYTQLTSVLSGTGPFTVFAPTNAAFQSAGINSENALKALPVETVKGILLYHVVGSQASSGSLPTAVNTPVKTVGESDIYITKGTSGVFINGSKVIQADVAAKNGVIHVIDRVLMPASANMVEALVNDANFSYLVTAVLRASEGAVDVKAALETTSPITVFAPTNQAFIDAGFGTIESIQAADPATLTGILTAHVVTARVFSNEVQDNLTVNALSGSPLLFNVGNSVTVRGPGNDSPATITAVDKLTTNGVVHVINKVLLP